MRRLAPVLLVLLLATPAFAQEGGPLLPPETLAIPDADLRGALVADEPTLPEVIAGLLRTDLAAHRRLVDRSTMSGAMKEAEARPSDLFEDRGKAALACRKSGAEQMLCVRVSAVGSAILLEGWLLDAKQGDWVGTTRLTLEAAEEIPDAVPRLAAGLGLMPAKAEPREPEEVDDDPSLPDIARMKRLLEGERKRRAELEEHIRKLEKVIENLRLLVPDPPGVNVPPPHQNAIDAVVTAVSDKANVVVLSVGSDDGVRVGYEFTVYRGNRYVGKVVVDRVEKDHCTGSSRKELEKSPIEKGDKATTRF